jgi:hypothetical protein
MDHEMLEITERQPERKSDHASVDDDRDRDLAVLLIASRFNLTVSVARVVCEHAGLGASDDRATAGKTA